MNGCSGSTGSVSGRSVRSARLYGCRSGRARRCVMRSGGAMRLPQMLLRLRFKVVECTGRRVQGRHADRSPGRNNQNQPSSANAGQIHPATSSQLWIPCRTPAHLATHLFLPMSCPASSSPVGQPPAIPPFSCGAPAPFKIGTPIRRFLHKFNPEKQNFASNSDVPEITFGCLFAYYTVFSPILELFFPRQAPFSP
jgi:hypothetical protein